MASALQKTRVTLLSLLGLGVFWAVIAQLLGDASVLPPPSEVWSVTLKEWHSGALVFHTTQTLLRVALAFGLAMTLGTLLGIVLGRYEGLNRWLDPWVVFFLNLPALVVIVLAYLWIGLNETAAIVAVAFNKTAMVVVTVREGVRALDPAVADMARVYRFSALARVRHVLIPQLAPFISTAVRNGLAVIWKIVLVVEFLGRSNGVGFQIHLYFQLFDTAHVLAYSLTFVGVMLSLEYLLVQPWEASARRWRKAAA
ncbi:ABC transporter permease [Tropicimonas sp. S265A]|uniref:ABC transporter permease n=1 Tax=Tropicimonas sp. S265A TaxID=3415134 RepID=UPI003C79F282